MLLDDGESLRIKPENLLQRLLAEVVGMQSRTEFNGNPNPNPNPYPNPYPKPKPNAKPNANPVSSWAARASALSESISSRRS